MDIGEQDGGIFYRYMKHMSDFVKHRSHLKYQKNLNSLWLFAKDYDNADHSEVLQAHLCFGSTLAASLYIFYSSTKGDQMQTCPHSQPGCWKPASPSFKSKKSAEIVSFPLKRQREDNLSSVTQLKDKDARLFALPSKNASLTPHGFKYLFKP